MTAKTKSIILLICLAAALMLTACQTHVDNDPWPASDGVTATEEPASAPEATQAPEDTQNNVQAQPTEVPEPVGEPGLNG